jgi:hypothetical protein
MRWKRVRREVMDEPVSGAGAGCRSRSFAI